MSRFVHVLDALGNAGWTIKPCSLSSDCWWAKGIWELRSNWSPSEKTIFLSLLIHPEADRDGTELPDKDVWAIGLSLDFPEDRFDAEDEFIWVGRRVNAVASKVVESADRLRAMT